MRKPLMYIAAFSVSAFLHQLGSAQSKAPPAFDQLAARAAQARAEGMTEEAISLYTRALRQRPRWSEGWWALGTGCHEQGRFTEARDAFRKLTALNPRSGAAWAMLGLSEYEMREYADALTHLRRGRERGLEAGSSLKFSAAYHEAVLHNRDGRFEAARGLLKPMARSGEGDDDLFMALGIALLRRARLPEELAAGERDLALLAGRAAFFDAANRHGEARQAYEELKARYADAPGVAYARGVFLLREFPDDALLEFRRELQLTPQHVEARLQIALELLRRNQADEGLPLAEQAARIEPDSAPAHYTLGRLLLATNRAERAVAELEVAAKLAPASAEIWFALGQGYERSGRKADAARARAEFSRLDKLRRSKEE